MASNSLLMWPWSCMLVNILATKYIMILLLLRWKTFIFHREVGNQWALEEAKRNLQRHYLLVGVTEELTDFIHTLQIVLPRFFKGANDLFLHSKQSIKERLYAMNNVPFHVSYIILLQITNRICDKRHKRKTFFQKRWKKFKKVLYGKWKTNSITMLYHSFTLWKDDSSMHQCKTRISVIFTKKSDQSRTNMLFISFYSSLVYAYWRTSLNDVFNKILRSLQRIKRVESKNLLFILRFHMLI